MCGIAAIFGYANEAPPVDRDELRRMRERMTTRGPDGEGEWFSADRRVGLGHRRLSIIDLSPAGAQPMFNASRSLAIVYNGEIYNYKELRAWLEAHDYEFRTHCDTEVLLALYEIYGGEKMFEDIRGMYAFAIWDEKKQCLFAARDPFGIKPLYYSDNGNTFRLASQVKALRAGRAIDLAPDPAGHVGFFLWGHVPDPSTMYRNIRSLPAGHFMRVDADGPHPPKCFCSISSILADAEVRGQRSEISQHLSAFRDANEILRSALAETVKYHLVADVPVGVFLSSGLDSTMIAALAANQGSDLRTVTLGFEEYKNSPADEVPLAEEFAKRCGAKHQTIWVSRADFEAERNHLFEAMDRPTTDGVNTFFVSLAAKRAGLKVALSGLGGDELFASYPSFEDVPRVANLLPRVLPLLPTFGRGFRVLAAPVLKRFTSPKYAGIFEYGGSYSGAYLLRRGMFMPWELPDFLDPDFVKEGWTELKTLARIDETLDDIRAPRLKVSALEMNWYMRHQLLRDSDWAGMGHSVEIRVPFVDLELLRQTGPLFAAQPELMKREVAQCALSGSGAISRELLFSVLARAKTGFQVPVRDWLLSGKAGNAELKSEKWADRGLRGWAVHVYRRFPNNQLGGAPSAKGKAQGRKGQEQSAKGEALSGPSRPSPLPVSFLPLSETPKRILVFRIGQLGDTIVALPAMWSVRKNFPDAHIALLYDWHPRTMHVQASDLLRGSKLFDEYLSYPVAETRELVRRGRMATLLIKIRQRKFDTLVYLAPTGRTTEQIERDRHFFAMAGIRNFIGMSGFETLEAKQPGVPLKKTRPEAELLLQRLGSSGLTIPTNAEPSLDLGLSTSDAIELDEWLRRLPGDGRRKWIAIGPGSKMPAKRWPLLRFEKVVRDLIKQFDIWPVVFGGEGDKIFGDWLLEQWHRGYNAAGALGIRPSLVAMHRCKMFLGNDTGTMHMAAAVGVRCVAIFSSRERPGLWYPHGTGHTVFRSDIECEGCGLIECLERENECLRLITTDEVLAACSEILSTVPHQQKTQAVLSSVEG